MKGHYLLLMECLNECEIEVGSLKKIKFRKGFYLYIGSGLNNLEKRIERHLRKNKKIRWHIDYLTTNDNFKIKEIFIKETNKKEEEVISREFEKYFEFIKNFGNSDCKDKSHLFIINDLNMFYHLVENLGFKVYDISKFHEEFYRC